MNDRKFLKAIDHEDMTFEEAIEATDIYLVTLEDTLQAQENPDVTEDPSLMAQLRAVKEYMTAHPTMTVFQRIWNDKSWSYVSEDGTEISKHQHGA